MTSAIKELFLSCDSNPSPLRVANGLWMDAQPMLDLFLIKRPDSRTIVVRSVRTIPGSTCSPPKKEQDVTDERDKIVDQIVSLKNQAGTTTSNVFP
ncbi:unnamed protein product [Clavelina lepadiformis]|uniref:Uncharacterized protein n=1 Tax=Clavelina lepadiformis TaxID=159417 RepID=A0ABP0G4V3_CLALP